MNMMAAVFARNTTVFQRIDLMEQADLPNQVRLRPAYRQPRQ